MAIEKVCIEEFLELAAANPVLDARSPGEFAHAHIPGAYNIPLFDDEERKVVGTAYKQQSREQAIKIGLDYFGVKMRKMVEEAEAIVNHRYPAIVLVHCWRGGMRSEAVAWLLNLYGFKVYLLIGGYKKFRAYVLETFSLPFQFRILAGFTGSGKTALLQTLAGRGQVIINLEEIANHKGSAFGGIGLSPQPSQEMFENEFALQLRKRVTDSIWVEDESQRIGGIITPSALWEQMQRSPIYFLDVPFDIRLSQVIREYGCLGHEQLKEAIMRIQKRLGGAESKQAIQYLVEDNLLASFRILLTYYDKCYAKSLVKRNKVEITFNKIICATVNDPINADKLLHALNDKSDYTSKTILL